MLYVDVQIIKIKHLQVGLGILGTSQFNKLHYTLLTILKSKKNADTAIIVYCMCYSTIYHLKTLHFV